MRPLTNPDLLRSFRSPLRTLQMAVHIRLARAGAKKVPFYRIVAADQRAPRGGRFIEKLGTWDPRRKELVLSRDRLDAWVAQGAQPSATVARLVKQSEKAAAAAAETAS